MEATQKKWLLTYILPAEVPHMSYVELCLVFVALVGGLAGPFLARPKLVFPGQNGKLTFLPHAAPRGNH